MGICSVLLFCYDRLKPFLFCFQVFQPCKMWQLEAPMFQLVTCLSFTSSSFPFFSYFLLKTKMMPMMWPRLKMIRNRNLFLASTTAICTEKNQKHYKTKSYIACLHKKLKTSRYKLALLFDKNYIFAYQKKSYFHIFLAAKAIFATLNVSCVLLKKISGKDAV